MAGCKALGLINKLLTGPLWHVLEEKMSILDMNGVCTSMRDQFKVWSEDASSFLEGQTTLFDDTTIKHDKIFDGLLTESSNNAVVQELLQVVFKAFYVLCERLLVDHLPGGIHDNPSEEMPDTVCTQDQQSVSQTLLNLTGFKKPNATTITLESLILSSNKTREWLLQNILFSKMAPKLRKLYQEGRKAIQQHRVNGK